MCCLLYWFSLRLNDCNTSLASSALVNISLRAATCLRQLDKLVFSHFAARGIERCPLRLLWQAPGIDQKKLNPSTYFFKKENVVVFLQSASTRRLPGPFHLWLNLTVNTSPLSEPALHQGPMLVLGSCATCPRDAPAKTVSIWFRPSNIAVPGKGQCWMKLNGLWPCGGAKKAESICHHVWVFVWLFAYLMEKLYACSVSLGNRLCVCVCVKAGYCCQTCVVMSAWGCGTHRNSRPLVPTWQPQC